MVILVFSTNGHVVNVWKYSFEVIILNKLHHLSLKARYPIGYTEWEPGELGESTLCFKCSVRLVIFL